MELQIEARGIINRGSFRIQIGAKEIVAEHSSVFP